MPEQAGKPICVSCKWFLKLLGMRPQCGHKGASLGIDFIYGYKLYRECVERNENGECLDFEKSS